MQDRKKTGHGNKTVITEPAQAPPAWDDEGEDCCTLRFNMEKKDPYVEIYRTWREFMTGLTPEERKFVQKLTCGNQDRCSPEEINKIASAMKGNLDKVAK